MTRAGGLLWATIALIGIGTFLFRLSFVHWFSKREIPPALGRLLRHVPAAVLCALIVPALLSQEGPAGSGSERWLAASAAGLVAARTKSVVLTIFVGMGTLWALERVFV